MDASGTPDAKMVYLVGATVVTPETVIDRGTVVIGGGTILAVGNADDLPPAPGATIIDGRDRYLVPGFIDLQINGAFGHDFTQEPESIPEVARRLTQFGVSAFLPTLVSAPSDAVWRAQAWMGSRAERVLSGAARPLGLHLEGPFLNPAEKGAHNLAHLRAPALDAIAEWSADRHIRMVTLAPELPDAIDVIATLAERRVVVAAGHSSATYEEARTGIEAGIRYGTHLFNAMAPLDHREPGVVAALLADDRVTIGLIADGIHVHPVLAGLLGQMLSRTRLNLVTDAMAGLGQAAPTEGEGRSKSEGYPLGDVQVELGDGAGRLADGTLAGSLLTLDRALRNLIQFSGCALEDAVRTITVTPANLLGLGDRKGRIAPGYDADLVFLDRELNVEDTMVGGTWAVATGGPEPHR